MKIRIHDLIPISNVNGPGKRFCIWVQGCNLNCYNCFNPKTHSFKAGKLYSVADIFQQIISTTNIDGISISGGEPFLQAEALLELIKMVKEKTKLSILIYSGFYLSELREKSINKEILDLTDILIAGRYEDELKIIEPFRSSSNQQIYFLSNRYSLEDFNSNTAEIIITENGSLIYSGLDSC